MRNERVGVFGLGIMGEALAANLQTDGRLVVSWNRSRKESSPCFEHNIIKATEKSDILLITVSDAAAVSEVLKAMAPALGKDKIVVNCATVGPDENLALSQRATATGAAFCEALMGGSKLAAVNRKLPFYLGGDKTTIDRVQPVLEPLSSVCLHVGKLGTASVAKLAMNLNLAMQLEALCESYAYARTNGLTDDQYFNVFRNNTGWNYLCEYKEPKLRSRDYAPQFSVRNMLKDIRLALQTDITVNGLTLLKETEAIYSRAESEGLGDEDMIALFKLIQPD